LGVLEKAKTYNVSEKQKKQAELLIEYVTARKEEIKAIEELINNESPENNERLNEINRKIEGVLQRLKELN
jgi:hypothetical protein